MPPWSGLHGCKRGTLRADGMPARFVFIMSILQVACAIIEQNGKVLCAQRSESMSLPLKWEFPGGKIQEGERPEDCLKRELLEELGVQISVCRPLAPLTHHYPAFSVTLHPFICRIAAGEITMREHSAVAWLPAGRLLELDWAEADVPLIKNYRSAAG